MGSHGTRRKVRLDFMESCFESMEVRSARDISWKVGDSSELGRNEEKNETDETAMVSWQTWQLLLPRLASLAPAQSLQESGQRETGKKPKKVKISCLQQTLNKTSSSLISTPQTINIIQQNSALISNMDSEDVDWKGLTTLEDGHDDDEAKKPVKHLRENENTQNPTDPVPDIPDEDPSEDLHDQKPPEAEIPEGENTISDPGDPNTNATTEEQPIANTPGPSSSQAGSGAQNTGSGQG
ncbi:hypothetical protein FNAPI_2443 [Fusarium napiforme]|uniref:Uncharacterized protein n=1 Tax=Fusarium napiforme TaxID=42672 RepID=A0A8H5JYW1_9HYPO|nr:hypothetical protein FNAPI_2443 [Fusarium napiforme]